MMGSHSATTIVPTFTTMKELQRVFKAIQLRRGTIHYLKFTTTARLRKCKAIALNSAEIKIVRTNAKTPSGEFSHEAIRYLIELLLQGVTWNYLQPTDGHGLVRTHRTRTITRYPYVSVMPLAEKDRNILYK